MRIPLFLRRFALPLAAVLLAVPPAALGSPVVYGEAEVAAEFQFARGDVLWLGVNGFEWELVTDVHDPDIANSGDGSFHPQDEKLVREALLAVRGFTRLLAVDVLILPYPRRTILKSSYENGVVFLSPGVREVAPEHVHAVVTHEIGHALQHARAPQGSPLWDEYVVLRGLDDPRFHDYADHKDRPREIFAEDFRFLFGGPLATSSGTIENPDLPLPTEVPGLRAWFEQLGRVRVAAAPEEPRERPASFPNPCRASEAGSVSFHFAAVEASAGVPTADVYDVTGRRIRTVRGNVGGRADLVTFVWDGRNAAGAPVAAGLYFARWVQRPEVGAARVHILR